IDGVGTFPRLLQYIEGGTVFNAINFSLEYNSLGGANFTAYTSVVNVFLCPSSQRAPQGGRDAIDPNDPMSVATGRGYGVQDYGPPVYTDIDPKGIAFNGPGASQVTPFRNKNFRNDGLLHAGKTAIGEVTDGTSNTIAIAEDAGRDARF